MVKVWRVGNQELYPEQIPFEPGTDGYYRYVAQWRARAAGIQYGQPGDIYDNKRWEVKTGDHLSGRDQEQNWWANYAKQTREMDYGSGYGAAGHTPVQQGGYAYTHNPAGGDYYDANGNGVQDANERGKYGGVGNPDTQNRAGMGPDNRWNDLWGYDARTDEQKFYDRDISGLQQVADANGTYNWYGTQTFRDGNGTTQKKQVNLTQLGQQSAGKGFDSQAVYNYNDVGVDKNWYDDQVRKRANVSIYGRTA